MMLLHGRETSKRPTYIHSSENLRSFGIAMQFSSREANLFLGGGKLLRRFLLLLFFHLSQNWPYFSQTFLSVSLRSPRDERRNISVIGFDLNLTALARSREKRAISSTNGRSSFFLKGGKIRRKSKEISLLPSISRQMEK